jgi:hypothetical protein
MFVMDEQKWKPLNHLLGSLAPGLLVDAAWLKGQGISRTSIHDYVKRGWLERVAPRVYRRAMAGRSAEKLRWDIAVMSAQRIGSGCFHLGGLTALELLGYGHFVRLGGLRTIDLYDSEGTAPSWLLKLDTGVTITVHRRALFTDPVLGVDWRRFDLGMERLGNIEASPASGEPWDHFLYVAGAERAVIEMIDEVPKTLSFEHADMIFEGLTTLRPKLLTRLLETSTSIRAKRLFLFFSDRHGHGWARHIDRDKIDLGRGKRQLVPNGRLDARYLITVPADLVAKAGEAEL